MKSKIRMGNEDFLALLCFFVIFIYSWAARGSDAVSTRFVQLFLTAIIPALLLIILIKTPRRAGFLKSDLVMALVVVVYFALNIFYNYVGGGFSRGLTTLACLILLYQTESVQSKTFVIFKKVLVASCIFGLICGLLLMLNLHGSILNDPVKENRQYVSYIFVYYCRMSSSFWRFCGFYNEPGALGTFCAFFLCADSLDLKKRENIILLIGGTLTFSVAFFVIIGIYELMKLATNWKYWVLIIVVVLFYIFVLPNIHTGNIAIDTVLQRITFDGDSLVGDHRTNYIMDRLYDETLHSNYIYFGRKLGFTTNVSGVSVNLVGGSIKSYIIDLGLLGTVLLFAPLCITGIKKAYGCRAGILYVIITFISLYQRSYLLHSISYFGIYICGLSFILFGNRSYIEDSIPKKKKIVWRK